MCPDPQLLSVYLDGELPSPWKEKMEAHLAECPSCREKLNSFRQLLNDHANEQPAEQEMIEAAKDRIWQNLQSRRSFQPRTGRDRSAGLWQRRLSIPLPAAAVAAIVIVFATAFLFGQPRNSGLANQPAEAYERAGFFLAADNEMPNIMPVADINSVLQFLAPDDTDIIILRLPENRSFSRAGEPEIIRAADYRRHP